MKKLNPQEYPIVSSVKPISFSSEKKCVSWESHTFMKNVMHLPNLCIYQTYAFTSFYSISANSFFLIYLHITQLAYFNQFFIQYPCILFVTGLPAKCSLFGAPTICTFFSPALCSSFCIHYIFSLLDILSFCPWVHYFVYLQILLFLSWYIFVFFFAFDACILNLYMPFLHSTL